MKYMIFFFIPLLFATLINRDKTEAQQQLYVAVVTVTQPIERGTVFTPEMVTGENPVVDVVFWPVESAPQTGFANLEDVIGLVAKLDLPTRTPLLTTNLVAAIAEVSNIGSDLALFTPLGRQAVPISPTLVASVPNGLQRFACVDVIAILDFGEGVSSTFTAGTGEVLELSQGIITVGLLPEDAVTLIWVQDNDLPIGLQFSESCD